MKKERILVTGAGGFIGSHLVQECMLNGHHVRAFVHYNSRSSAGWLDETGSNPDLEVVQGDIRDFDSVRRAMSGCDVVYHLAALIGIPYSYVSPLAYVRTNVEGTYNILESARDLGVGDVLITSTSETYGTAQYVPIDEKHPAVGQSPYAATKIAADQLALSYWRSFNLPVKVVRPFNTYGPRQSSRAVIPTIILQILAGSKSLQLGNVSPTRDLTFVKDTVKGFLEIHQSPSLVGQVTNIGMNQEISIRDLAHLIADILRVKVEIARDDGRLRPERSEVERLMCDNRKLIAGTGWRPRYDLRAGLEETVTWFRGNAELSRSATYTI